MTPLDKYVFTEETLEIDGHILHQIQAIRDFGEIHAGDLGGFIEVEANLSNTGTCWVYPNGYIYGDVYVFGSTKVYGNTELKEGK